jgi:hypothetical protein
MTKPRQPQLESSSATHVSDRGGFAGKRPSSWRASGPRGALEQVGGVDLLAVLGTASAGAPGDAVAAVRSHGVSCEPYARYTGWVWRQRAGSLWLCAPRQAPHPRNDARHFGARRMTRCAGSPHKHAHVRRPAARDVEVSLYPGGTSPLFEGSRGRVCPLVIRRGTVRHIRRRRESVRTSRAPPSTATPTSSPARAAVASPSSTETRHGPRAARDLRRCAGSSA